MIEAILEPFKYDFMIRSLVTAIASGTMLSLLGPFAVNRNCLLYTSDAADELE